MKNSLNKLKNINSTHYRVIKDLKITAILSISIYFASSLFIFIMNLETDYDNLRHGFLITILFYGQLIIFAINFAIFKDKKVLERLKIKFEQRFEIILRFSTFFIFNLNFSRVGLNIPINYKYIIISFSFMVSGYIIAHMHKKIKTAGDKLIDIETLSNDRENQKEALDYISVFGLILYAYSIDLIGNELGLVFLMLKFVAFCSAVSFIMKKLQSHYKTINKVNNRKYLIMGSLVIGFCLSFLVAIIVQYYLNDISRVDLIGIRDVMFIVVMLWGMPLINEYKKLNR